MGRGAGKGGRNGTQWLGNKQQGLVGFEGDESEAPLFSLEVDTVLSQIVGQKMIICAAESERRHCIERWGSESRNAYDCLTPLPLVCLPCESMVGKD